MDIINDEYTEIRQGNRRRGMLATSRTETLPTDCPSIKCAFFIKIKKSIDADGWMVRLSNHTHSSDRSLVATRRGLESMPTNGTESSLKEETDRGIGI